MKYVAIDFETANNEAISACSVGLAKFENGELIDSYYSLINPPSSYFSPNNISIHNIRPEYVKDAPTFDKIWPEILMFIDNKLVIAHNAPFDIGIVKAMLGFYSIPVPPLHYTDTLRISRKVFTGMPNHKLTSLSAAFGFDYQAHHALDDAVNCAKLFHKACPLQDEQEVIDFFNSIDIRFQKMTGGYAPLEAKVDKEEPLGLF
ncbi:MAG: 3'-5' exonuclease [Sphaerochaetaceae bacterium]|nr:3'-5' exonuclease [Sphaerochaetaceae bacterium]